MLSRGTVYATLSVERHGTAPLVRVNEEVLDAVLGAINGPHRQARCRAPLLDGILAIKVVDVVEPDEAEEERHAAEAAVMDGFATSLDQLTEMRRHEGDAIAASSRRAWASS